MARRNRMNALGKTRNILKPLSQSPASSSPEAASESPQPFISLDRSRTGRQEELLKKGSAPISEEIAHPAPSLEPSPQDADSVVEALPQPFQKKPVLSTWPMSLHLSHFAPGPVPALPEELSSPTTKLVKSAAKDLDRWHVLGEAVVGLKHRRLGLPGQDAVAWTQKPRPILLLSDGAGSAMASELGAQALVTGLRRFLCSLDDLLQPWLDETPMRQPATAMDEMWAWTKRIVSHAQGILTDAAEHHRRPVADLRGTLLLVVLGQHAGFALKVGDGAVVVRDQSGLHVMLGNTDSKGEFANETFFVDGIREGSPISARYFPLEEISGIALMSDGAAEKLVSFRGDQVASRMGTWLDELGKAKLSAEHLTAAFYSPEMTERTTLDDRSLVMAAYPPS